MKCMLGILVAVVVWLPLATAKTASGESSVLSSFDETIAGSYLVEFEEGQSVDGFFEGLRDAGIEFTRRLTFDSPVFRGASFGILNNTNSEEPFPQSLATELKSKHSWPVQGIPKPELRSQTLTPGLKKDGAKIRRRSSEEGHAPHVQTQIDKLHAKGYTGKGLRVAVIDTGVDYTHPALGGCFGTGCLVSFGANLAESSGPDAGDEDDDAMDFDGHGTHVSGIIAAQLNEYGFVGAAPGVELGMYKVGGVGDFTPSDQFLAALTMAVEDGADIISMSMFTGPGWRNDPVAIAASRIVKQGVPVVMSQGNGGERGLWSGIAPAAGSLVTAVGSSTISSIPVFLVEGSWSVEGESAIEFGWVPAIEPTLDGEFTRPVWATSVDFDEGNLACEPITIDVPDLSEYFVLARLDPKECAPWTIVQNLINVGADYILLYAADVPTLLDSELGWTEDAAVSLIMPSDAKAWIERLKNGKKVTVTTKKPANDTTYLEIVENDRDPHNPSIYTGWGPTWDVDVKPQVIAPGSFILSTYPVSLGSYIVLSGTSMSTPLVAGLYALLMEARDTKDPLELLHVLTACAEPLKFFNGDYVTDMVAPIAQQGTGVVQGMRSAKASTMLSMNSFSFNDTAHFKGNHTFEIVNKGKDEITYTVSHVGGSAVVTFDEKTLLSRLAYPNNLISETAEIEFDSHTFTVPAGGSAEVALNGIAPQGLNETLLPVYGGYVKVEGSNDETLLLPYLGVAATLQDTAVFLPGENRGHFITRFPDPATLPLDVTSILQPVPANTTFVLPRPTPGQSLYPDEGDLVWVYTPRTGSLNLRLDLVDLGNQVPPVEKFFEYNIAGKIISSLRVGNVVSTYGAFRGLLNGDVVVPEGRYLFLISALRVNGDVNERDDWDIVEMTPFILKYS